MANTFAPSEQAFDKVATQGPSIKDAGATIAAQDAYKIGICGKAAYMEKTPAANPNTLDVPPLWNHPAPESKSMSSSKVSPDEDVRDAKKVTALFAPTNANAMDGTEKNGKGTDKSGWGPYEALELDLKPIAKPHAVGDKTK